MSARSSPLTMIGQPPPPAPAESCSETATLKPSVRQRGERQLRCPRGLARQVHVVGEPDREHARCWRRARERRLERLGAGVRVARDGRLDELDRRGRRGGSSSASSASPRRRVGGRALRRRDGDGQDVLAAGVDEGGRQQRERATSRRRTGATAMPSVAHRVSATAQGELEDRRVDALPDGLAAARRLVDLDVHRASRRSRPARG